MNVSDLKLGDQARILSYAEGSEQYRARLLALGMTPGEIIRVVTVAPLGDPIGVKIRGYNLSIRKSEASVINIEGV